MTPALITPAQARQIARELFLKYYAGQAEWFDLAWSCYARIRFQNQPTINLRDLPGLGANTLMDPLTSQMASHFATFAASFFINSPMAREQLLQNLEKETVKNPQLQPQVSRLKRVAQMVMDQFGDRFFAWLSRKDTLGSDEIPNATADEIKTYRTAKDAFDIFVDYGDVWLKQAEEKPSSHIPEFGDINLKLLCILLRYKGDQVNTRELYQKLAGGAAVPSKDDRYIVSHYLAYTLTRFRARMKGHLRPGIFTVPKKRAGYGCRGNFRSCVIVPAAAEPNFRVLRTQ